MRGIFQCQPILKQKFGGKDNADGTKTKVNYQYHMICTNENMSEVQKSGKVFEQGTVFSFWSEKDLSLSLGKPIFCDLDISSGKSGMFISFFDIVNINR